MDIVILCGGSGTRLFPLSTKEKPKQFLHLTDKDMTMFQLTLLRAQNIGYQRLYIVSNVIHRNIIQEQIQIISSENIIIIYEPLGRNTAPSIASICHLSASSSFLVLSTDHCWNDVKFKSCVEKAQEILNDKIVVFGIKPTYPETGYGYLECKDDKLISFTEKPNEINAKKFLKNGNFLWNSGNFLFSKSFLIEQFKIFAIELYSQMQLILGKSSIIDNEVFLNELEYFKLENISIDFAIMNYQKNLNVVKYNDYWKDIGSFKSLKEHLEQFHTNDELLEQIQSFL